MGEQQRRTARAAAMADVAAEVTADLGDLSPAERAKEMMRAEALSMTASALVSGKAPPCFADDPRVAARWHAGR